MTVSTNQIANLEPLLSSRSATVTRKTGETNVTVSIDLDGTGKCVANTGIPFLDHMLNQISAHGLIDLEIHATGDLEIDDREMESQYRLHI